MNSQHKSFFFLFSIFLTGLFSACTGSPDNDAVVHGEEHEPASHEEGVVTLTEKQAAVLDLQLDTIPRRNLSTTVKANGSLEIPPQNEARVSTFLGGTIARIEVIEGDKVRKGQTLALLEHPDFIQMQTNLQEMDSRLTYLQQEYDRQKRLYEQEIGAGKTFQETESEYRTLQARVKGLKTQLQMLGVPPEKVMGGELVRYLPVTSPISGAIKKVLVKTGEYVASNSALFEVVDNEHVHADLMVFEQDVSKVKVGQQVRFTVANQPGEIYTAKIYSVGSVFEDEPKALHLHAEIVGHPEGLLPGMYVQGRIEVEGFSTPALPQEAIVREGEKSYIFVLTDRREDSLPPKGKMLSVRQSDHTSAGPALTLEMVEVRTGAEDLGWVEIEPVERLAGGAKVAFSGAYYLLSEMQKGEMEHSH